ncbi:MAG: CHAT domain-containing protein, partial [Phenylobacterium sp.]
NPLEREKIIAHTRHIASQLFQLSQTQQLEATAIAKKAAKTPQTVKIQSVDIKAVQAQLSPQSLILYFDTGSSQSHLWAVSHSDIELYRLPADQILSEQVSAVLALVNGPPVVGAAKRRKKQTVAMALVADALFANTDIHWQHFKQLIVIPDGPLHYLPLSLLTLPGQSRALVEDKPVTYAPSLAVWQQLSNRVDNHQQDKILLVANPAMVKVEGNKGSDSVASLRAGFEASELPYTKKEADSVMAIAGQKVSLLSRENASKEQLLAQELTDYQILHFATHGLSNSDVSSLGGLVLSNSASANNLLLVPEISNLNINAELVVLSGCKTAVGKLIDGEGLQGLSRAFFEAGGKRVIGSLWSVQDDATATLMGAFYRLLLVDKKPPAEALRLAKLAVKNHQRNAFSGHQQQPWQDPFYWAGFVLQGSQGAWID